MKTFKMATKLIVLMCVVVLCKGIDIASLKLEQVLILSRHNVRTPLIDDLETHSSKSWPKWNTSAGFLTDKGAKLEAYMGEYIAEWLKYEDFMEGCPNQDEVLIYANTKQRTIASAEAFAESAFRSCNITVNHLKNLSIFDPVFFPILHNKTDAYKNQIKEEMANKLHEIDLTQSYLELNRILNIGDSDICKKKKMCDLTSIKSKIVTEDDEEPNVSGPLFIGNAIVDSFIMSYYEGMPKEEVAWGEIATDEQWELLAKISRQNQNVRFNLTTGSKDLAGPLLEYMTHIFKNGAPKFTLLMGHDSNLNPVISALGFKQFKLPHQFEPFPIGGKVIFQKWTDNASQYLKVEYVYPSTAQLRNSDRLTVLQPPQKVLLELVSCPVSPTGFCPWSQFMNLNVFQYVLFESINLELEHAHQSKVKTVADQSN